MHVHPDTQQSTSNCATLYGYIDEWLGVAVMLGIEMLIIYFVSLILCSSLPLMLIRHSQHVLCTRYINATYIATPYFIAITDQCSVFWR